MRNKYLRFDFLKFQEIAILYIQIQKKKAEQQEQLLSLSCLYELPFYGCHRS